MKLRTRLVLLGSRMSADGEAADAWHDAMAAHAYKKAEREADALFDSGTRWYRARAWINTRAAEILAGWLGEDRNG